MRYKPEGVAAIENLLYLQVAWTCAIVSIISTLRPCYVILLLNSNYNDISDVKSS